MHKVCFRILLRQCKRINLIGDQSSGSLYLQSIPNPRDERQQSFAADLNFELSNIIKKLIPPPIDSFVARNLSSRCITTSQLKKLIVSAYDTFKKDKSLDSNAFVDLELQCIKLLNEQMRIARSSSLIFHRDIRVIATAVYFKSESTPPFSFFYRITLENLSPHPWRLCGRHWLFECSKGTVEVPKYSHGVIGLTPVIQPGTSFTYMSMTFMNSIPGSMKGSFSMLNEENGDTFELPVGSVSLSTELFTE